MNIKDIREYDDEENEVSLFAQEVAAMTRLVKRGARRPTSDTPPLRVHSFSGEVFTAGIETHELEGVPVRVYSAPKTVADCFKYRNKIGIEVALEALRDRLRQRKATVDEI